jgi:curved DNA-binding protein
MAAGPCVDARARPATPDPTLRSTSIMLDQARGTGMMRQLQSEPPVSFDPYDLLGVTPAATADEVRRAYRILARRYHPDINKDETAELQFKELSRAYSVLGDARRRALFDEFGEASLNVEFDPERARSQRFRGAGQAQPEVRGRRSDARDVTAQLEIDGTRATAGGRIRISSPVGGGALTVVIPPGTVDGARLRLPGKGLAGGPGCRPGDLFVVIRVRGD